MTEPRTFCPGDLVRTKEATRVMTVIGFKEGYSERPVGRPIEHVVVGWFDDSLHDNSWTEWPYPASQLTLVLSIAIDPSVQSV